MRDSYDPAIRFLLSSSGLSWLVPRMTVVSAIGMSQATSLGTKMNTVSPSGAAGSECPVSPLVKPRFHQVKHAFSHIKPMYIKAETGFNETPARNIV